MNQKRSKWLGLLLLMSSLPIFAVSFEEDAGPMPPPDGPFFSSKPLLYFGEEPSATEMKDIQSIPAPSGSPQPIRGAYPAQQGYPGYYGPSPLGTGRNMMQRQMPVYPPGWGPGWDAQSPYNRNNPNYSGYPPFPERWGVNPR